MVKNQYETKSVNKNTPILCCCAPAQINIMYIEDENHHGFSEKNQRNMALNIDLQYCMLA